MSTMSRRLPHLAAALLFTAAFAACGPGTEQQDTKCCNPIHSSRDPMLGCDAMTGCDTYPDTVGYVSVYLVNNLRVEAIFYADGGGAEATTTYHTSVWLLPGASGVLRNAMSGPMGSTLTMSTLLAPSGYARYTLNGSVYVNTASIACTVTAVYDVDGHAILTSDCV